MPRYFFLGRNTQEHAMITITSCATQSLSLADEFDAAFEAIIARPDQETQGDHNDADFFCFVSIL